MTKIFFALFFYCLSGFAYAADYGADYGILHRKTLLDERKDKVNFGVFAGPMVKFANINGDNKVLFGGQLAVLINQSFYVGVGGFENITDLSGDFSSSKYEGAFLGAYINERETIHTFIELGLWAGNIREDSSGGTSEDDDFLIIEPAIGFALNISRYTKAMISLSYRYADGVNLEGISQDDLSGISFNGMLTIGVFD